jgi:putative N6-adenine-specific DNA methylase
MKGGWQVAWRATLELRGAVRVLVRIASFPTPQLSDLERGVRIVPWTRILRPGVPFRVEATCARSRIYHTGAAAERVADAVRKVTGAPLIDAAEVAVRVRIENNHCTISVDTSGEPLYKRGHKEAVGKAPMRETMAALFLLQCGFTGNEPVLDPMCGAGTFVIEAAQIAAGLPAGRARTFAFEQLATFDAKTWSGIRERADARRRPLEGVRHYGRDRDPGAIRMSRENAKRAGVLDLVDFTEADIDRLAPPAGSPGLVITNPPYGARVGDRRDLARLYRMLGDRLRGQFSGWRVGIVTADPELAKASALPFLPALAPVSHGGLRVSLYRTAALP